MKHLIDKLGREKALTKTEWITLLNGRTPDLANIFLQRRETFAISITAGISIFEG